MKTLFTISIVFLFTATYSQDIRHIETINEYWKFHKGDIEKPFESNNGIHWDDIDLPHTWNAYDIMDDEKGYYRGIGFYKKTLIVPNVFESQKVFLHFEAANQVTTVYINGTKVDSTHIGGYTPFVYDITKLLKKENEIAVKVDNAHNEQIIPLYADYNFYGGIYRDVHLVITKPVHFDMLNMGSNGVFITTQDVSEKSASISIKSSIVNPENNRYLLRNKLIDADRETIAESKQQKAINGENQTTFEISNPRLWSPEHPNLYTLVSEITDKKGNVVDRVENPVGFRWFRFDAQTGFYLNGEHLKLIGTNRHQDYFESGFAVPDELHRYDIKLLKDMGINFLRISHYPQDPSVLEKCDEYGILTTVEIPFVNKAAAGEQGLNNSVNMMRETIRSNYNHPCIVAWNTGNETTWENPQKQGEAYLEHFIKTHSTLAKVVKEEDTTRYSYTVFYKSPKLHHEMGIRLTEMAGHNQYAGWYFGDLKSIKGVANFAKQSVEIDGKPFILSEYGAGADSRIRSLKPEVFDFSMEYQTLLHKEHLKVIQNTPEVSGANIWNFADFQSEMRIDAVPHMNNKGLVTLKREPKDAYYFYQAALSREPILVIPSKLWRIRSGIADSETQYACNQPLEIFSNQTEGELFLNGTSLGKKKFDYFTASWDVPFVDGKNLLEVQSVSNGHIIKDFLEIDFKLQPFNLKSKELPFTEIAVNVGSNCYFIEDDNHNYLWVPDQEYRDGSFGYVGGEKLYTNKTIGSKQNILGTKYDPVFQTQQIGLSAYKFDVPNGNYELTLYFTEVDSQSNNQMNILLNGKNIWNDLNLKKQFGQSRAVSKRFAISVSNDKGIQVDFQAKTGSTRLSGIKLRKIK